MQLGAGAPKAFLTAALAGLEQLARLRVGAIQPPGPSGVPERRRDQGRGCRRDEIRLFAAIPGSFAVETSLTGAAREAPPPAPPAQQAAAPSPPPAAAAGAGTTAPLAAKDCQAKLMDIVRATPVQFEMRQFPAQAGIHRRARRPGRRGQPMPGRLVRNFRPYRRCRLHRRKYRRLSRRRAWRVAIIWSPPESMRIALPRKAMAKPGRSFPTIRMKTGRKIAASNSI